MVAMSKSKGLLPLLLTVLFGLQAAYAGPNEGFTFTIDPTAVLEPSLGQTFDITISVGGATEAKGTRIQLAYDAAILQAKNFTSGSLIPGMISPGLLPKGTGADGLDIVEGGGTQLLGTPGSGDGTLGIFTFEVIGALPIEGTFISLIKFELNAGAQPEDKDILTFASGQQGIAVERTFTNRIFDLSVSPTNNRASLRWRTLLAGINDRVRYRPAGSEGPYQTATNALLDEIPAQQLEEALALLRELDQSLEDENAVIEILSETFGTLPSGTVQTLRQVKEQINRTEHVVSLTSLEPGTTYEYQAISIGLDGESSAPNTGTFRTRNQLDNRALTVTRFDAQTTTTSATFRWETNRLADTRVLIGSEDSDEVREIIIDEEGATNHIVSFANLTPGTTYFLAASSRLVGVDDLIASGLLSEDQITVDRSGSFKTKTTVQPVRLTRRPQTVVGPASAVAIFSLNQTAIIRVDYGKVANFSAKITQDTQVNESEVYTDSAFSTALVDKHFIALSELDPATEYRYRIAATTPDGRTFTTDPRGNEQWSKDLRFTTSDATDLNPATIINGPQVKSFGSGAAIVWRTDVPTLAKIFYGTVGPDGTLGTSDEFEKSDTGPDGFPTFSRKHRIVITGLDLSTQYGYRIESTAPNGQVSVFSPLNAGAAKALQPPGGAGSFTTRNKVDTQFPVILTGPTVTGKSHDTATIEWSTDESASSQARFTRIDSVEADEQSVSDGDIQTRHKLVLSNLQPGTSYTYFIGSTDAIGNGITESGRAYLTTDSQIDLTPPAIVDGPDIIYKNDRRATISWKTNEDASGQVAFGTTADQLNFIRTQLTSSTDHSITLTNLQPSTEYFFQVSSEDLSNNGPTQSAVSSFTTDSGPDFNSPQLSNIRAIPSRNRAIIRWRTNEIADSFVDFGSSGPPLSAGKTTQDRVSAFFQQGGNLDEKEGEIDDVTEHEILLTNLEPGTTYVYAVGSTDPADNPFSQSETFSFTTPLTDDVTPPASPTGLQAIPGPGQILLGWLPNTDADLDSYTIQRRQGDDGEFSTIASGLQETSYVDLSLENDIPYSYRIFAFDRAVLANASEPSTVVNATPSASAGPQPPTALDTGGADFLRPLLSFDNASPFVADATLTYTIQVSSRDDFSNVTASIANLTQDSGAAGTGRTGWVIDRGLEEGVAYFWRVRAVENGIFGVFSEPLQYIAQAVAALPGDFNGDNNVDFDDFFLFVDNFGQPATGDAIPFDLDNDGEVGLSDFFLFVDSFGQTGAGKQWATAPTTNTTTALELTASGGGRPENGLVTLAIHAKDLDRIKAFGLVLGFNPDAVELVEARPGQDQPIGGIEAPLFALLAQHPGELVLGNGLTQGEPVSGDGLLAELDFRLIGSPNEAYFDLREAFVASPATRTSRIANLGSAQLTPQDFHLGANYPNPFNPSTTIEYALPRSGPVSLHIYDVLGRRVRTLVQKADHPLGFYNLKWDGLDQVGRSVGSGLYFYRLIAPGFVRTQKMALVK
jgi:hypothetical protein